MALTFFLLSLVVLAVNGFNYFFSTTTKVYVPDRRFKSGRRFSHSRKMSDSELATFRKNARWWIIASLVAGFIALAMGLK